MALQQKRGETLFESVRDAIHGQSEMKLNKRVTFLTMGRGNFLTFASELNKGISLLLTTWRTQLRRRVTFLGQCARQFFDLELQRNRGVILLTIASNNSLTLGDAAK